MGRTMHDRVRLKRRYALLNFNRLQMAAMGVTATLALVVAAVQFLN